MNKKTVFKVLEWLFKAGRIITGISFVILILSCLAILFSDIPTSAYTEALGYPSIGHLEPIRIVLILAVAFISLFLLYKIYSHAILFVQNIQNNQIFVAENSDLLRKTAIYIVIHTLIDSSLLWDLIMGDPINFASTFSWSSFIFALILVGFAFIIDNGNTKPS